MLRNLYQYLDEIYSSNQYRDLSKNLKKTYIQIDDQDDKDNISEFCNIFVTPCRKNNFILELLGPLPVTQEIADLAEIYHGMANQSLNRVTLTLNHKQIEVILDLVTLIRNTSSLGNRVGNLNWQQHSARTISSLHRFVRIMKEYISLREAQLI